MVEETSSGRIEELKARLAADPEFRVFYQLGEELRKHGHTEEAEEVLRKGLETHPAYLSAWISLGRVLQDSGRPAEAVDVLNRAFEIDRQNVVVARLLGDSYRAMGEDIEAIKKYKLVAALHPADEEVHEVIKEIATRLASAEELEAAPERAAVPPGSPPNPEPEPEREEESSSERAEAETAKEPSGSLEMVAGEPQQESSGEAMEEDLRPPFDDYETRYPEGQPVSYAELEGQELPPDTDSEIPAATGSEQWSEDSAPPGGAELDEEPGETSWTGEEPVPPREAPLETSEDDVVATVTMGDLYARQGHLEQAREIYRRILERDPGNAEASGRLELLGEADDQEISPTRAKVVRLEQWLSRIRD
jgi:tetratricopeptide (TPR) repeat protein